MVFSTMDGNRSIVNVCKQVYEWNRNNHHATAYHYRIAYIRIIHHIEVASVIGENKALV
jgi:hypothetical protein